MQFICGICGNESSVYPKTDKEFESLVPSGWFTVNTPVELTDPKNPECNPNPVPYRVCSIECLHAMEQLLQDLKEKAKNKQKGGTYGQTDKR